MIAEMSMQNELLKEALGKSLKAISATRDGHEGGGGAWGQCRAGMPHVPDQ